MNGCGHRALARPGVPLADGFRPFSRVSRRCRGRSIADARVAGDAAQTRTLAGGRRSRDNVAMTTLPNSAALLETVERETGPQPRWTVLWLHGLGADGHDFAPIVPELVGPDWPAVRFVFPHAPVRPVTINNGMRMRAWYDIRDFSNLANRADREGVEQSVAQVDALIAREGERGVPPERIVLAGFSQGGAVTLAAGLRRTRPLAGLVVLSSYLPTVPADTDVPEPARRQPAFVAHGRQDPVVPFAAGQQTVGVLRGFGLDVQWQAYPMAHQVCAEQIADLRGWFAKRFADQA
jgi:phospholipase/carboxylesterase